MNHQDRKGRKEDLISITPGRPRRFLYKMILSLTKGKDPTRRRKLGNDMEVKKTLVTPFERWINFGKSSGEKQEDGHLGKNYFKKYVEEKSHSSFKTITRTEFEKRKSSFEISSSAPNDFPSKIYKKNVNRFREKEPGFRFTSKARSLDDLLGSGDECEAREKQMARKLEEIHQMVQKMHKMAGKPVREKWVTKKTFLPRDKSKLWGAHHPPFETSCKLNRKLIPTHFSSSFTTELGSTRKSFTEKIIFQSRFVPEPSCRRLPIDVRPEKENAFRSTLEIVCLPETEIHLSKPFVFR